MQDLEEFENWDAKALMGEPLSDIEIDKIFRILEKGRPEDQYRAALLLTALDDDILKRLTTDFFSYQPRVQDLLIPLFAEAGRYPTIKFLFSLLKSVKNQHTRDAVTFCLSRTDYFIFPILLIGLDDPSPRYKKSIIAIIKARGFHKIRHHLAMFPIIPNEKIFRELFGNDAIDDLYKDPDTSA